MLLRLFAKGYVKRDLLRDRISGSRSVGLKAVTGFVIDGVYRRAVADYFPDEGQGGALPVDPFLVQTIGFGVLFGQL